MQWRMVISSVDGMQKIDLAIWRALDSGHAMQKIGPAIHLLPSDQDSTARRLVLPWRDALVEILQQLANLPN